MRSSLSDVRREFSDHSRHRALPRLVVERDRLHARDDAAHAVADEHEALRETVDFLRLRQFLAEGAARSRPRDCRSDS